MKLLLVSVCLLTALIGLINARGSAKSPPAYTFLERRSGILESMVKRTLHQLQLQGREHLGESLEHKIVLIRAVFEYVNVQGPMTPEKAHTIELGLWHLENDVIEELANIEHAAGHEHRGYSAKELIIRADILLELANSALKQTTEKPDITTGLAIQHEISLIEQLKAKLDSNLDMAEWKKEEQIVVRHAKTLEKLISKLNS